MQGLYLEKPTELKLKDYSEDGKMNLKDVKIRLNIGGICGSDLSVYKGTIPHAKYPVRPGHELLGNIIEAGEEAKHRIGEKVVIQPNSYCESCEYCKKGLTNICEKKTSLGVNTNGGFLEEFTIESKYAIKVPESLPDQKAVLVEPLAVIVHALKMVNIDSDKNVAVIGCGTEGMLAITLTDYLGGNVTAIDINHKKLKKVKDHFPDAVLKTPDETDIKYDIVIEAAGTKSSVESSFLLAKPGGSIVLIGMTPEANFPVNHIVRSEVTLFGSIIYKAPDDFNTSIAYLTDEKFNVDAVISGIYHFTDFAKAYEAALSGEYGKILLDFKKK